MKRDQSRTINAPPFRRNEIIELAEQITFKYARSVGNERAQLGISFDLVFDNVIYPEYEIELVDDKDLGEDDEGSKILGCFDPVNNTAYIDACLQPSTHDRRRAFTCCHEVGGHGVLQGQWLRSEWKRLNRQSAIITTQASLTPETEHLLERQANLFAAHLAAPTWLLIHVIQRVFGFEPHHRFRYTGAGLYSFALRSGTQRCEVRSFDGLCQKIAYYIRGWFGGLSVEALSYRVMECPLVVDASQKTFNLFRRARGSQSSRRLIPAATCNEQNSIPVGV